MKPDIKPDTEHDLDVMSKALTFEERQLLAWKAGLTYTRPWPGALQTLQEKGLVTDGNIMSSALTDAGRAALNEAERQS